MAKLLTGTRIYGTGTVDTQLFVSGTNSATSTTTGALQVVGGVGVGGNLYVGGTIFGGTITGTASTATNADNIKTVLSTSTSVFFPVFVDSNNATAGYEAVYSSSTFTIIPSSGNVGIGVATPTEKLHVVGNYVLLKNNADTAAGAVFDSGSTLGQNTQILLRDRGSDKWAIRKNSANDFDIYGSAAGTVALTIFSSTNFIGIGTSTPLSKFVVNGGTVNSTTYTSSEARIADGTLHLMKTSAGGVFEALRAINNDTTVGTTVRLLAAATSDPFNNANGGKVFIDAVRTAANMDLIFSLNDTGGAAAVERLRILGSGAIAFNGSTNYGITGQILQSNGNAAPTWISTGSLFAANATTATHLSGGVAGQIPYQTAPGVTAFLSTGTAGDVLVSNGSSAATYNNTLRLAGSTNATSTTSGALQVVGGVGVGGDLFIQGDIRTNDTLFNLINSTATTVNFAGAATTLTMGASGSGTTNVRNNLTVSGNLTVQGTTTIVDSTVTNIADPIITLGGGTGDTAPTADDNKDRGVAFKWVNNGGTTSTGFFGYDDSTGYFTYVQTATITNEVVSGTKGAMDVNLAGGSAMAIVYQSSPNNTAFLAAGSSGFILQTNGTGSAPTWVSASGVSAGSATYADNVRTIAQTGNAAHFLTFVDSNNASNTYESLYTTSSFSINPATGLVTISGASGDGVPILRVTGTSAPAAGFNWAGSFMNSSLTTSKNTVILIGQAESTKNSGYIGFNYAGTAGSNSSFMTIGLYANDNILNVTGGGNVGVGTTIPAAKLHVAGSSSTDFKALTLRNGDGTVGSTVILGFEVSAGTLGDDAALAAQIKGIRAGAGTNGALAFLTTNAGVPAERMRLTTNGGISFGASGTAYGSSGQILQSNGDAAPTWVTAISGSSAQVNTVLQTSNATYYPAFVDSNNASATAESLYTTSSFTINALSGRVGIGGAVSTAKLHVQGTGAVPSPNATTNSNGLLRLRTADAVYVDIGAYGVSPWTTWMQSGDTGSAAYYAMAINPLGGNVGIGTTSTSYKLDVAGSGRFTPAAVNDQGFFVTSAAGAVNHYFDVQLAPAGGAYSYLRFQVAGNNIFTWGSSLSAYANDLALNSPSGAITLSANGSERLRITSSGGIAFGGSTNYGTSGQMLQSNGNAAPTWVELSSRTVGTSTQVNTVLQTANATYYPTFVDANNATAAAESLYTTGTIVLNPSYGSVGIGANPSINSYGSATTSIKLNLQHTPPQNTTVDDVLRLSSKFVAASNTASAQIGSGPAIVFAGGIGDNQSRDRARIVAVYEGSNLSGLAFHTQTTADALAEAMRITNNGRVGIGTTSSGAKLEIGGTNPTINIGPASVSSGAYLSYNTSGNYFTINAVTQGVSYRNIGIANDGGSVGIGTAAPDSKLHVEVANATAYTAANTLVSGQTARISNTDGTSGVSANLLFVAKGAGGGNGLGSISGVNTGVGSLAFTFGTRHASSNVTERMRITSDGNVVIGATTTTNKFEVAGTAGQLFSVSDSFTGTIFSVNDISGIPSIEVLDTGLVKMAQYNGQLAIGTGTVASSTVTVSIYGMLQTMGTLGEIRASSEITAYFSSDSRLKENIKLIENPITIIDQIRGVTFDWTDEHMARRGGEDGYFVRKHDIGVIAQEVQAVLPELVGTREDGYLAVKYEKMVPLLIEAIKSQQKTIDSLVKDLADVKEFINQLKNNK